MKIEHPSTIAIIDSGIGGLSILNQLIKKYKSGNYIYFADNKFMPYGNKNKDFVKNRVIEIIDFLKSTYRASKIIIACNTASSCLYGINDESLELLTFDKNKTYLTTELTQKNLKGYSTICAKNLAYEIENNIQNKHKINKIIKKIVKELNLANLNSFVLGCTHYELVADLFNKYCKNSKIELNSTNVLKTIKLTNDANFKLTLILSDNNKKYREKIFYVLNKINKSI